MTFFALRMGWTHESPARKLGGSGQVYKRQAPNGALRIRSALRWICEEAASTAFRKPSPEQ